MAIDSQTISQLESRVGVEQPPLVYAIERGMIQRFVQAVGDPNPLWQDDEYASKSPYGGVIAPPNFILTLGFTQMLEAFLSDPALTVLHGSTELESHLPVKPGDVITATSKITGVRERQGKAGQTAFVTVELTYRNQRQETVARCNQMILIY